MSISFFIHGVQESDTRSHHLPKSPTFNLFKRDVHPFEGKIVEFDNGFDMDGCVRVNTVSSEIYNQKVALWQGLKSRSVQVMTGSVILAAAGVICAIGPFAAQAIAIYALSAAFFSLAVVAFIRYRQAGGELANWLQAREGIIELRKRIGQEGFPVFNQQPESIELVTDTERKSLWMQEYKKCGEEIERVAKLSDEEKRAFVEHFLKMRLFSTTFEALNGKSGKTYPGLVKLHKQISNWEDLSKQFAGAEAKLPLEGAVALFDQLAAIAKKQLPGLKIPT